MADGTLHRGALQARDVPEAVQWHEGMLLSPQHFQQCSRRSETLLNYHMGLASPFHWGLTKLHVDRSALVAGLFRVIELEGVMPDGLMVHFTDTSVSAETDDPDDSLAVALTPGEKVYGTYITVYLAVARLTENGSLVSGELARYRQDSGDQVVDSNTGEDAVVVPRIRPKLRLLAGNPPDDKYVFMPVARLEYVNQSFRLASGYISPRFTIGGDSELGRRCEKVCALAREKAAYLYERANSAVARRDTKVRLGAERLIHYLTSGLPVFEALLSSGAAHPFSLYLGLCGLAGQVACVGHNNIPPHLPPYQHGDIYGSFDKVLGFIEATLDEINVSYRVLPFKEKSGTFSLDQQNAAFVAPLTVGVRGREGFREADLVRWMERCVIGRVSDITGLMDRRVKGFARRRIDRDDGIGLVPPRDVLLYSLTENSARAGDIDSIAIVDPTVGRSGYNVLEAPLEVVLYVAS